jgi:hypothetical protein
MQDSQNVARTAPGLSGPLDNSTVGHLAHLSEMDNYEIADGEPNIKGWDVRSALHRSQAREGAGDER